MHITLRNNRLIKKWRNLNATKTISFLAVEAARCGYEDLFLLYLRKGADDYVGAARAAAFAGHFSFIQKFEKLIEPYTTKLGSGSWENWKNVALEGASTGNRGEIVRFLIADGARKWNWGLEGACNSGQQDLAELFIQKGATNLDAGLFYAARSGHEHIIKLLISHGADYFNFGLHGAAEGGHVKIVQDFLSRGASNYFGALYHASFGGHRMLVELFMNKMTAEQKGVSEEDLNCALGNAARGGHKELVEYFVGLGVSRYGLDEGLLEASRHGRLDLVNYFLKKGAKKLSVALTEAYLGGHLDVIYMIRDHQDDSRATRSMK